MQGRLLILQAQGGNLSLVAQKEVKGPVWQVQAFQARPSHCRCAATLAGTAAQQDKGFARSARQLIPYHPTHCPLV